MFISLTLNGKMIADLADADMTLYAFLRKHHCYSVKCGCETSNCGLCTVLLNDKPVLSCSVPLGRVSGCRVDTLEGLEEEAGEFIGFLAEQGADQCGFCNPGYVMNIIAMLREIPDPSDEEIRQYLSGNLCRCTGYESQTRALRNFLNARKGKTEGLDLDAKVYGEELGKRFSVLSEDELLRSISERAGNAAGSAGAENPTAGAGTPMMGGGTPASSADGSGTTAGPAVCADSSDSTSGKGADA
ncbi:MAG: hypothetical protein IJ061_02320 [Lachnospiraceae bacterium]|nr:hypothetical protein [Lachnospiraceae bacterium]